MTDYEHIVISAVRYALGRITYIVELTVNYVLEEIEKRDIEFTEYCEFKIVCDRNCKHCIEQYFKRRANQC